LEIVSVFPTDGAIGVSPYLNWVSVHFNNDISSTDAIYNNMNLDVQKNASFGIIKEDDLGSLFSGHKIVGFYAFAGDTLSKAEIASFFVNAGSRIPIAANTKYTVTFSGTIKDVHGQELVCEKTWSFTTGADTLHILQ
jgi:hypothetical protein